MSVTQAFLMLGAELGLKLRENEVELILNTKEFKKVQFNFSGVNDCDPSNEKQTEFTVFGFVIKERNANG